MALSPEARAKISEAMKRRHAEAKASGKSWLKRKGKKKAGLAGETQLVRQLKAEIEERRLLLSLLEGRGMK